VFPVPFQATFSLAFSRSGSFVVIHWQDGLPCPLQHGYLQLSVQNQGLLFCFMNHQYPRRDSNP
jgi:hypothetical protein